MVTSSNGRATISTRRGPAAEAGLVDAVRIAATADVLQGISVMARRLASASEKISSATGRHRGAAFQHLHSSGVVAVATAGRAAIGVDIQEVAPSPSQLNNPAIGQS